MTLTDEEIRIKVAEAMGLEIIHDPRGPIDTRPSPYSIKRKLFYTPAAAGVRRKSWPKASAVPIIPNYPESLDACAEFEKTLTTEQRHDYVRALRHITEAWDAMPEFTTTFATARQRCLAYLKTKGILP